MKCRFKMVPLSGDIRSFSGVQSSFFCARTSYPKYPLWRDVYSIALLWGWVPLASWFMLATILLRDFHKLIIWGFWSSLVPHSQQHRRWYMNETRDKDPHHHCHHHHHHHHHQHHHHLSNIASSSFKWFHIYSKITRIISQFFNNFQHQKALISQVSQPLISPAALPSSLPAPP